VTLDWLRLVDASLQDADAQLATDLGGRQEVTAARLWHDQVLVDWQPDPLAGDCLLRAALLRQLIASGARVKEDGHAVVITAPGRAVASLSDHHADLVRRLGGARRVSLTVRLRFVDGAYVGGDETFSLVSGRRPTELLHLTVDVRVRSSGALQRTSPAPT
jgi:antitoxin (DNA-binding transcriptional repressor) of toxin-antitoxin stability system